MNPNLIVLQSLIALIAEAAKDIELAAGPGQSALARILDLEGIVPKLVAFLPQLKGLSFSGLQPSDYISLAEGLVSDLGISNAHAKSIIDASFKLISDGAQYMLPDAEALIAAIKPAPIESLK